VSDPVYQMSLHKTKINVDRFRQHRRRIPWRLIANILIVSFVGFAIWYIAQEIRERKQEKSENQIEIEY